MIALDTNLLVYASVPVLPQHRRALDAIEAARREDTLAVPVQCLREFLVVMSRPQAWSKQACMSEALSLVRDFQATMAVLIEGQATWDAFLGLIGRYQLGGKQVHDANIAASLVAHGVTRLLTFNGADFRRFAPLIEVVEP